MIPWGTILKQAPVILAAAETLLASSRRRPPAPTATDDHSLRLRLEQIEEHQRADAEVTKQLADQVSALAVAAQANAARVRIAMALGILGTILGVVACLSRHFSLTTLTTVLGRGRRSGRRLRTDGFLRMIVAHRLACRRHLLGACIAQDLLRAIRPLAVVAVD